MKVLHAHIITGIAGSESYLIKTLPALKKKGIEIEFLCIYRSGNKIQTKEFVEILTSEGIKVHYLPIGGLSYFYAIQRLKKIVFSQPFDFIHTHLIHADVVLSAFKKFVNPSIKLISTKHGYEEKYTVSNRKSIGKRPFNLYFWLALWAEKQIDKSYAISKSLKDFYVWLNIAQPSQMEVINYGFDFSESTSNLNLLPKDKFNLVIVGRLEETKGHVYAIRAIKKIVKRHPNLLLTIVGSGSYKSVIQKEIEQLSLHDFVKLEGYKPNGIDYFNAADVVLIPSIREGFGIVVLEAFSKKKPIVVFDVPAVNEIIEDQYTGLIVPPFSTDEFAQKLEKLIQSKALREELGNNGYNVWKEHYSLEKMLVGTISFYNRFMTTPPKKDKVIIFTISYFGGGTEKVCRLISEELTKNKEIHVILLSKKNYEKINSSAEVYFLTNEEEMSYLYKFIIIPVLVWRLINYINKHEINLVVSMLSRPNYISVLAKKFRKGKTRLLISERTYTGSEYNGFNIVHLVSKRLTKWLYPQSDLLIVNSKALGEHLHKDFGIQKEQTRLIYNGVKVSENTFLPTVSYQDILMIGRLDKNKSHALVIDALSKIDQKIKLTILGEGPEMENLQNQAKYNKLENRVYFTGYVFQLTTYFERHKAFILASNHEGFPNVLLEALAAGCFIISTDCLSGPREILDPNSNPSGILSSGFELVEFGILFAVNDKQALINAINFMYNNPNEVAQIQAKAKKRAAFFSEKNMINKYAELFN